MKIRKLNQNDLPCRVNWMNTPVVYRNMHFTPPISLDNTINWYNKNQALSSRHDMVFEDENGESVAMGGLTNIDFSLRKGEFYIFVNPYRHNEGIGTKATKLLCQYGFQILNLHKIFLYTNSENLIARKTYEKVGFKLEGIHRDEMIINEQFKDRYYYGLLASEFDSDNVSLKFD